MLQLLQSTAARVGLNQAELKWQDFTAGRVPHLEAARAAEQLKQAALTACQAEVT